MGDGSGHTKGIVSGDITEGWIDRMWSEVGRAVGGGGVKGSVKVLQGSDLGVRMDGGRRAPVGSPGTLCIGSQGWGEAQVLLRSSYKSQV